jgi:hypothetical protein
MKKFLKWIKSLFSKKQDTITIPPKPQQEPEPVPIPVPTPIDWDSMKCWQIKEKIEEIKQLLMTSKFIEIIRLYWEAELTKGETIYEKKCGILEA